MSEPENPPDHSGILKASSPGADQIFIGMTVSTIDGKDVGKVKEVTATEFLVDRPLVRDLWIPFSAVVETSARGEAFRRGPSLSTEVVLSVAYDDLHSQGWRHP